LDAGRLGAIGVGWLLDGRRGSKDFRHAQRSSRSADWLGTSAHGIGQCLSE
jgi:hypothetical protein